MAQFEVRVKGRSIKTYEHEGKTFIEGRKGSDYTLHFYNNSSQRKKIVVSVDGLNIISGDAVWQRGYVVEPWQTIDIPGWRVNSEKVAAFEFSSIKGSYNQQNDSGEKRNIGVIGCMVFNEKPKPQYYTNVHHWHYYYPNTWLSGGMGIGGYSGTFQGRGLNTVNLNNVNDGHSSYNASGVSGICCSASPSEKIMRSSAKATAKATAKSTTKLDCSDDVLFRLAPEPEPQSVGTGYGEKKSFKTTTVDYEFEANPVETLLIHYDDWNGLKQRGIIRTRSERKPQAFPGFGDGCPPPRRRRRW